MEYSRRFRNEEKGSLALQPRNGQSNRAKNLAPNETTGNATSKRQSRRFGLVFICGRRPKPFGLQCLFKQNCNSHLHRTAPLRRVRLKSFLQIPRVANPPFIKCFAFISFFRSCHDAHNKPLSKKEQSLISIVLLFLTSFKII